MAKTLAQMWGRPPLPMGQTDGGRTFGGGALLGPVEDFEGINNEQTTNREQISTGVQPDTEGDVGLRNYVQWVNTSFAVYSKDGRRLLGPMPGNVLWQDLPSPCATSNAGDPMVLYDEAAGRWIFTQFTGSSGLEYYQCIAVSTSDDPTGYYTRYVVEMPELGPQTARYELLNDYSKLSVWKESYVLTDVQKDEPGVGVFAFDRAAMLNGLPARVFYFDLPNQAPMLPSDLDGPLVPPSGPLLVQGPDASDSAVSMTPDALTLRRLHVGFGTSPAASIEPPFPPIGEDVRFPTLCPGDAQECVPQPGAGAATLDAIDDRPMFRAAYRSFGSFGRLVVLRTVGAGDPNHPHAALRWYEIRDEAGRPSLIRAGTYGDGDSAWRWMGSAALDKQGDIGLGFSLSDPSGARPIYPSIGFAGVPANSTTPTAEGRLATGGAAQKGHREWGDYSSLSVDPADQCTFWYTQEYYPAGEPPPAAGETPWHTRIGSFKFAGCGATPSIATDPSLGTGEGGVLTAQPGDWSGLAGGPPLSLAYEWRRCDAVGGSCAAIPGADRPTYRLTSSDVDSTIRVAVRATTATAFVSAVSPPTGRVSPIPATVPLDLFARTDPVPQTVLPGSDVVFRIRVSNQTLAGTATHVVLTDTPGTAADIVSAESDRGSGCDSTARPIVCPLGYLQPGVTATVTVTLRTSARGRLENTAGVSEDQADPGPSPNTTTAATLVAGPPVLQALAPLRVARARGGRIVVSTRLSVDEPATVTATVHAIGSQARLPLRHGSVLGATVLGHTRSRISTARAEGGAFDLALRLARRQLRAARYAIAVTAVAADGTTTSLRLPFSRRPAS
jgi:hypothetical protein